MKTKIKINGYTSPFYRTSTAEVLEGEMTPLIEMWLEQMLSLGALNLALDERAMHMGDPLAKARMESYWERFSQ